VVTEAFLKAFVAFAPTTHARFWPRLKVRAALNHLFAYLAEAKVCTLPRPERVRKPYHWCSVPRFFRELSPIGFVVNREAAPRC
jgi:hypothetical protein